MDLGFAPASEGMLTESGWNAVRGDAEGGPSGPPPGYEDRGAAEGGASGLSLGELLAGDLPGALAGRVEEALRQVAERHHGTLKLVDAVAAAGPDGGAVVVVVERQPSADPAVDDVARRLGLTRRQAAVALLLARRRSNAEIAMTLAVSPHTARHHTERVLEKLGVTSRNRVAEVVFGAR